MKAAILAGGPARDRARKPPSIIHLTPKDEIGVYPELTTVVLDYAAAHIGEFPSVGF